MEKIDPILKATYLWDFGGTKREKITVKEIEHKIVPARKHGDGSYSPETVRTKVRISSGEWIGWYGGRAFELLGTPL